MLELILAGSLLMNNGVISQRPNYEFYEDHFVLREDIGGDVGHYAKHFADIERRSIPVRIVGDCLSACTMILKNKLACAMPGARFGFHLAHKYNPETKETLGLSDYGNKVLWEHYPIHVRQRLGTIPLNMIYIKATDFIRPCKPESAARPTKTVSMPGVNAIGAVETASRFTLDKSFLFR